MNPVIAKELDDVLEKAVERIQKRFNCSKSVAIAYLRERANEQFDECFPRKCEPQNAETCP